ncbi:DUF3293 domain-containing protein [Actinomycetospora sp. OC33-EN08]|uniref:DUF3293 domain-containing protein n=1 Tax=Actinomycetospora aurantiaca TaxID=3129233 RepID=A0ABU8MPE8_9PSEU
MQAWEEREERFAGYRRAGLRVPGLTELRPADEGTDEFPFDGPVHVLTAYDPGPARYGAAENERRQQALLEDLPAGVQRWSAVAGAEDGSHAEASVVVRGLTDAQALDLARRHGQDAVFRWTAEAWSILPCDGGPPVHQGWRTVR